MSTLVQLLATYYKAVLESERIYYENVNIYASPSTGTNSSGSDSSSRVVEEMFLLQRQVSQLTAEIQSLRRENDDLKSLQATHKALMESKLNNSKKIIEKLKREQRNDQAAASNESATTPPPAKLRKKQAPFHLLSPMNSRKLDGRTQNNANEATSQPTRLRYVLKGGHQTLFDGDQTMENLSADRSEEAIFVNSLKHKDELANIVLPSDALSDNDGTQAPGKLKKSQPALGGVDVSKRKRKLIRKRIQTANSDNDD
ncbi:hypothetical protein HG536_0A05720 [Torulaspora globosa]|uniref:Uncharacterized protein n=1 Tax=Torulaspora globosa TaxID=48254 RepID=A0A7G3ZB71_9SACH|nr:uncharacterized protein HG536_0A05720 [Torulaspora globosa]QLL30757.1 hypothetical protein HG536_0A05720 [Torulaspora globosa]